MQQVDAALLPLPPLPDGPAHSRTPERTANLVRFQAELEFIQCLSNPYYLHELSVQSYFSRPGFTNYLAYLEYWRSPEYVRFIVYPTCLVYLTMLQSEEFRIRLADPTFVAELVRVGQRHHETWRTTKKAPDIPGEAEVKVGIMDGS